MLQPFVQLSLRACGKYFFLEKKPCDVINCNLISHDAITVANPAGYRERLRWHDGVCSHLCGVACVSKDRQTEGWRFNPQLP